MAGANSHVKFWRNTIDCCTVEETELCQHTLPLAPPTVSLAHSQ